MRNKNTRSKKRQMRCLLTILSKVRALSGRDGVSETANKHLTNAECELVRAYGIINSEVKK